VDVKDSAEYWEVTALPEGCNTPDGYIRVRFEEDGSVSHYDPALLTPRFVHLDEETPVDVSGYPVKGKSKFWEIVESRPDEEVYIVNKPGAPDSEKMAIDFKKVRQRPRAYSEVDHPEYFTTSRHPSKKHPHYLFSGAYRKRMFTKKRREARIASGSLPPKKADDEKGYLNHPATKYNKQWREDNEDWLREWRENYEPYCCFCGRACNVSACICGGKGTGKKQLADLVRRTLDLALTDGLGGELTDENCRLLTGFPADEVQQILKAAIPDNVNIEELLEKKCMQRNFRYPACVIHKDHIKAVAQWLRELRQKPGWNRDKTPNDALRLINRIENLQYLIWRANLDKGSDYTEAIRNDLAEYEKCFYSATQLRESDVLSRKYLPLSKVLKNVKAWAARRGGAGAWQPIGVPAVSHSSREVRKLMAL